MSSRALASFPPHRTRRATDAEASLPVRLIVPQACPNCQAGEGQIRLTSTIEGRAATPRWWCGGCLHEWPVRASELDAAERRAGTMDRRRRTRSDRRQTP